MNQFIYTVTACCTCLVDFLTPLCIFQRRPGPALATCLPISYSLVTGLPITADLILPNSDMTDLDFLEGAVSCKDLCQWQRKLTSNYFSILYLPDSI